jgi:hypothetical protein
VLGNHAGGRFETPRFREAGRAQDGKAQGVEQLGPEPAVADRERPDRVAVVRASEREERRATGDTAIVPVLERDLQRLLHGGRAIGRVEEMRIVDGNDGGECLRQLDDDAIAVPEHGRVRASGQLPPDRVVEFGNAVSEGRDPQRRNRVEVVAAVEVDEVVPFRSLDDDRAVAGVGRHLREPVPHNRGVSLHPRFLVALAALRSAHRVLGGQGHDCGAQC